MGVAARSRKSSYLWEVGNVVRLSIPIHKNQMLKTGLQRHLMKQAGLEEQDL
jgi:predicted RNA binding protein YcfA (HicA-like mRNA interferase family)